MASAETQDGLRVMWLLNHRTLRQFEMPQLKSVGVREIFLPKSFPYDEGNLSASVDASFDSTISLAPEDIAVLNATDWYGTPSETAWEIANGHFDLLFFAFFPRQIESVTRSFRGDAVLRVFGHARGYTYSGLLYQYLGVPGVERIRRMGDRFWFGEAYSHLHEIEDEFIRRRALYLPLGLHNAEVEDRWHGSDARLYFVCPRIGSSGHFRSVYAQFKREFKGIDYVIGGAQPVTVSDPRVIGYVPADVHRDNMQRFRVMYYHSTEPNHVHYHPFEAIRAGMPVVYMAGGMLDRLAGARLPGCCKGVAEARRKVERLIRGDTELAEAIRKSQVRLLEPMHPTRCAPIWQENFRRICVRRAARAAVPRPKEATTRRVAIIVPSVSRPAELTYASRMADAIAEGARASGESAQVVVAVASDSLDSASREFAPVGPGISMRAFQWKRLPRETAEIALNFSGHEARLLSRDYIIPDDGINNLLDCDVWIVTSDELTLPLFPLRPYCIAAFGYPQRYMALHEAGADLPYRLAAQRATFVWAASESVASEVAQYGGVSPERIRVMPPAPPPSHEESDTDARAWWPSSIGIVIDGIPHPRQVTAIEAVQRYYTHLHGKLPIIAIGRGPSAVNADGYTLAPEVLAGVQNDRRLRTRLIWDPVLPRDRKGVLRALRCLVFTGYGDGPARYLGDALGAGVPLVAIDALPVRELATQYPGLVELVADGDVGALARCMKAFDGRDGHPAVAAPFDELAYRRAANQYWQAVLEAS